MEANEIKVEYVPIDAVTPYERNTRRHAEEDVSAIAASIEQFGFLDPIGVWHDTIVEGHGRLLAAKQLGLKEIPVIRLDGLTDEQRRAYAIAHNKTAELSEWSHERVQEEINSLDINMALFGFWDSDKQDVDGDVDGGDGADAPGKQPAMNKDTMVSDAGVTCPRCGAWVVKGDAVDELTAAADMAETEDNDDGAEAEYDG